MADFFKFSMNVNSSTAKIKFCHEKLISLISISHLKVRRTGKRE